MSLESGTAFLNYKAGQVVLDSTAGTTKWGNLKFCYNQKKEEITPPPQTYLCDL